MGGVPGVERLDDPSVETFHGFILHRHCHPHDLFTGFREGCHLNVAWDYQFRLIAVRGEGIFMDDKENLQLPVGYFGNQAPFIEPLW